MLKPSNKKPIAEITPHNKAYGIWVFTCSITGILAIIEDRIVESEIGEQWSPKTALEIIAPKTRGVLASKLAARGIDIGINIATVPPLVPVVKDIKTPIRNTINGKIFTLTFVHRLAIYEPVSRVCKTLLIAKESPRIITIFRKSDIPSMLHFR